MAPPPTRGLCLARGRLHFTPLGRRAAEAPTGAFVDARDSRRFCVDGEAVNGQVLFATEVETGDDVDLVTSKMR